MNLPTYGCKRWTCFVRSRSGRSRSDHESSRSMSAYSASCVGATRASSTRCSESLGDAREPALAEGDHVEGDDQTASLGMLGEPGLGGAPPAALLLDVDHLERVTEPSAGLLLDLAEHEPAPAAGDHVQLVPAGPDVRAQ